MHKIFKKNKLKGEWFNIGFERAVIELKKLDFKPTQENKEISKNIEKIEEFFIDSFFKDYEEIKPMLNLEKWIPTYEDLEKAKNEIRQYIRYCLEDCNEEEWAKEWQEKLDILSNNTNSQIKKSIIQEFYKNVLYSFEYTDIKSIRKHIGEKEMDFIEKVLGINYEVYNPIKEEYYKRNYNK
ncbi:hypothetical protein ABG79_02437 [Caloramator mitchellensis]|uniref:Uncharacterized protein n=2 Tax=Caloramator mitchellensis TaxID=908809 RepID=A0A0R3JQR5_CALMK|nr:hypothetical protein ABG79_02437 [Caloramator mitchellensis]